MLRIAQQESNDCLSAVLASLLHIPRERIPNFYRGTKDWPAMLRKVQRWLAVNHRLTLVEVEFTGRNKRDLPWTACAVPVYAMGFMRYSIGATHAVVVRIDGSVIRVIHDPDFKHPDRTGDPKPRLEGVAFLCPTIAPASALCPSKPRVD